MRFLLIAMAVATFLFSKAALAKDVGLVIWMEDIAAFNKKSYAIEMDHYRKTNPELEFKTIYFKSSKTKDFEERFQETLSELDSEDKISLLILATHGNTESKTNRTSLSKLGTFGADGVNGDLKRMIELVGPKLSPNLKLLLESCSTFCGTKENLLIRTRGLYNELAQYGVNDLSVWGATQTMMTSQLDRRTIYTFLKSVNSKVAKLIMPLGIVASVAARDLHPMIMSGAFIASINALAYAQYITSGTRGYEVEMKKDDQWAVLRDYYSEKLFSEDVRCESIFSP